MPCPHRPALLPAAGLLALLVLLPGIARAEGGYTGLLTLVVGIPLMLLGNVLLGITAALRRRRWARASAVIVMAGLTLLGICTASDAWVLLNRGNEDVGIGAAFFVLWGLAAALTVVALRGARLPPAQLPSPRQ